MLGQECSGINGDIVPILERLDPWWMWSSPATHQACVCDYGRINPARPFLLTSAGQYGALLTEVSLRVDTATRQVVRKLPTTTSPCRARHLPAARDWCP